MARRRGGSVVIGQGPGASSGSRSKAPLVVAAVVGLALVFVVRAVAGGGGGGPDRSPGSSGGPRANGACVSLAVTASSEKAALLSGLASAYNKAAHTVAGRCARVTVTSKASGAAEEALARGWDEAVDGPRPDVWSPASTSWTVLLRERLATRDAPGLVPDALPSIAKTPLVLAMPRPMAQVLGWPGKPLGWGDLLALARDPAGWGGFGHPEWGRFKLGKTNPDFSTSGLNATIGTFFAATGRSSDLSAADVTNPVTTAYVQGVESSVVHYGDTTLTFLSNLQAADDRGQGLTYISAVAVEEKSVWDYNEGNPTGDPATLGKHAKPRTPLVAIYPKEGTLLSDNPYAVLTAPWVDDAKRAVAADLLSFVQSASSQQRFADAAFRDFSGKPGSRITPASGLLPEQPSVVISPPSPPVLAQVQRSFDVLRKRARVLLVIDVSGSMGDAVPRSGASKLDLAKKAAVKAVDQLAPDDQLGLWVFSTGLGGPQQPYLELVPVAPVGQDLDAVKRRIGDLVAGGGTALYATARAAEKAMTAAYDPARINAIVLLTDGRNEYPQDTDLDGLVGSLRSESDDTAVRIFPIAYGDDADLPSLRRIAEGSRGAAYDASDPASIDKVFTAVISNF